LQLQHEPASGRGSSISNVASNQVRKILERLWRKVVEGRGIEG